MKMRFINDNVADVRVHVDERYSGVLTQLFLLSLVFSLFRSFPKAGRGPFSWGCFPMSFEKEEFHLKLEIKAHCYVKVISSVISVAMTGSNCLFFN